MTDPSPPTKDRLLEAAEHLFASRGFDEVSIRELAAAAGVNIAAVNYHFQGKENLFHEVCARRFSAQRDRTLQALEALQKESNPPPTLAMVIRTLVNEYLEGTLAADGGPGFLMAVSRELHEPEACDRGAMFKNMIQPVFSSFSSALQNVAPQLDPDQMTWIIASIVGQIPHFIMRWVKKEAMDPQNETYGIMLRIFPVLGEPLPVYIEQVTDHITRFTTAAITGMNREESA